jgi:hypothetical protein
MLFLVDHIRYLAKAEDLSSPAMQVHLRIIPALAAEGFDADLLICGAPYFNTPAFLTQRSQAAIALYDGLWVIAYAAQFHARAVCSHKRTLHCFSQGNCECHATFHPWLRHHDINKLRDSMGIYPALLCL